MRIRWFVIGGLALGASALASACGADTATVGNSDAGTGSETSTPPDDGGGTPTDAGDDGGEVVTDGGSNIDPDAGLDDGGVFPDGGLCNTVTNDAAPVVSTCISILPALNGGALVAGKYWLTNVAAIASPAFCQNQFIPTGFKETLDLTVAADGTGTLQAVFEIGGPPAHHRTSTVKPGANDTSPGTAQALCPTLGTAENVRYASRVSPGGKQVLLALLPYGKGAAVYRFEKQ